jgi:phosphate transport system substrate-binding protein
MLGRVVVRKGSLAAKTRQPRRAQLVVATVLLLAGCGRDPHRALSLVGSTSIQPFAEVLAEHYAKSHPGKSVDVQGGGSTAGLQAATNGLADIGMCSRSLKADEAGQFTPILIARDGLAVVVHPTNPVRDLSLEQLRGLFSGQISDWQTVGGSSGPVWPITREEGSGTRESFVHLVMGQASISRRALTQESNGAVKELVKGDPATIGYMSLGLVGSELGVVAVGGVPPTTGDVLAGRYPLSRPLLFVTRGSPRPAAAEFVSFVLSPEGQTILETEGLVRAR